MSQRRYINYEIKYHLLVSFVGLFLIVLLTVFPPKFAGDLSWRKLVVGSVFGSICILGILAVFSPNQCLKFFKSGKKEKIDRLVLTNIVSHRISNGLEGHHPTCGKFAAHIFRIKSRTFCAACLGLLFGGLLALVGATVYFFGNCSFTEYSLLMILLGIMGVVFGLFQFKFKNFIRLSVNIIFVLGTLSILIAIDELVKSLFVDLFVVCLVVFWLLTRILLSQWDHERICSDCEIRNCGIRA